MTEKPKKQRYKYNDVYKYSESRTVFVRAWTTGRGRNAEHTVQVWNSGKPEGEPTEEWFMPGVLPFDAAIRQAIAQTDE